MLNIRNEEKNLKRYLKNKVSLNENTVVKILITGTLAFTLTACGGGGSSQETANTQSPSEDIKTEVINKKNEGYQVVGKDIKIEGTITGDSSVKSLVGITAKNSNVESYAKINLTGEEAIGISGTTDGKRAVYTIKNNGNISLSGKNSIGMYAKNGVIAENNGVITGSGEGKYQHKNDGTVIEDSFGTIGIGIINGSKGINNKDIIMTGAYTTGMYAENNSTIENNGKISLTSKIVVENEIEGEVYSSEKGMRANSNSVAINNGTITGSGQITGIDARESSQGTNNGNIELESLSQDKDNIISSGEYYKIVQKQVLSKVRGMRGRDEGTVVINNKNIKLAGNAVGIEVDKQASGINSGNISLNSIEITEEYYSKILDDSIENNDLKMVNEGIAYSNLIGMLGKNSSRIVNSEAGNIQLKGTGIGMEALNNSKAENNGKIEVESKQEKYIYLVPGEYFGNEYYDWTEVIGMRANDSEIINNGTINVLHNGIGMQGINNSSIINNGSIRVITSDLDYPIAIGIEAESNSINKGTIEIDTKAGLAIGMEISNRISDIKETLNDRNAQIIVKGDSAKGIVIGNSSIITDNNNKGNMQNYITNNGLISIEGIGRENEYEHEISTGIESYNYALESKGKIVNTGKIEVESLCQAIGINSVGDDVLNDGTISVNGKNAIGIKIERQFSGQNAIATNNGTITIDGEGAIGMYAGANSTAINAEKGVINVGSLAQAGMVADGENAEVINYGTINILQRDDLTDKNKENFALQAKNNGKIENHGTINIEGDLNLTTGKDSSYVIGTTKDGEYGKISAKTAKLDGDVVVSTQITKSGFKNEYTLQNVVDAEDITLGDDFKFNSDSLLYDATAKTDTWGNLDATLTRNDKILADYSTDETKENAEVFGKYYAEELYKNLSSDAQAVISAIDTRSKENLNKNLGELKPTIYSNISRQILDTNKFFKEQEKEVINTLGENEYNFAFIGDYKDVDSKGLIEGYTSKASGFIGAINLGNDIFGAIGYSYNDIDYKDNSNGNIQTIHLGLNKILTYEKFDISLGLNGEYNFNEYNREIEFLNRNAKSDFNSYAVGFTSEISRVFGKESYLKPYLGLDVTYLNYESFKEKNANSLNVAMDSQDYVSVLPKVGIGIGNKFNNLRTFANVEYSYELGNMNKSQTYMFEGFEGKAKLENDNLENTLVTTKVGASYEMNTLSLTGTVGKEFGKRDNTFVTVSLGYKF